MKKMPGAADAPSSDLPTWLPQSAINYLLHTETGISIRELARSSACHASTVSRQIRNFEARREDALVDEGLKRLGRQFFQNIKDVRKKDPIHMNDMEHGRHNDDSRVAQDARRVLRRLNETGAVMAVSNDLKKAVVLRGQPGRETTRTAIVDTEVAQSLALKDWISCKKKGRVSQYEITQAGRAALKRMVAEQSGGFQESQAIFAEQHRIWGNKKVAGGHDAGQSRQIRYNLAESPLAALARRKGKDGKPFLSNDLVTAGERLREDFELAQMGPRVGQNWEKFLTAGARGQFSADSGIGNGPERARDRVQAALSDLGPGLGDVALRCCCYLEGMETAEKRMGWSARSGKIVLRIALQRLKRHYDELHGSHGPMIG